jgi:DMSO/TMAO reductase YedYZ heme-binding membrane subunit
VYFAVPLSILHYFLLDRDFKDQVLVYAVLVGILFVMRLPAVRRALARFRQRLSATAREDEWKYD